MTARHPVGEQSLPVGCGVKQRQALSSVKEQWSRWEGRHRGEASPGKAQAFSSEPSESMEKGLKRVVDKE